MNRILVLRGGALGDFVVTLPALRALRGRWPGAQIELVGNARAAELGLVSGVLNGVHSQHEAHWAQLYDSAPLSTALQSWLDSFDLVISFWPDPEGELGRHFRACRATFLAGTATVATQPAAAHFCTALEPLGIRETDYSIRLELPDEVHAEAERRLVGLTHFLAFHPGSGSRAKNWPLQRWSELAARLSRPLLAVTGEAERQHPLWPADVEVRPAHAWPLPVLAAALARCELFVGHDSGVSHLAASVGARCVTLFGPTDPDVWAPPGASAVRHEAGLDALSVEAVAVRLATHLPKTRLNARG